MNIHPLFVHFPIGLLVCYSLLEIACLLFPVIRRSSWSFSVRVFLALFGILWAVPTIITGLLAKELVTVPGSPSPVLALHQTFALSTVATYAVAALAYLIAVWGKKTMKTEGVYRAAERFIASPLASLFALSGMVLITITGGLGAAMVYGPDIDPFVKFIYSLFF